MNPNPHPTPKVKSIFMCVLYISVRSRVYYMYVCVLHFQSQEQSSPALTQCVRKDLAMAVRDLMQHGLMEVRFIFTPHPLPPSPWPTHTFITCMFITVLSILARSNGGQICTPFPFHVCKSNHVHVYCNCYQYM